MQLAVQYSLVNNIWSHSMPSAYIPSSAPSSGGLLKSLDLKSGQHQLRRHGNRIKTLLQAKKIGGIYHRMHPNWLTTKHGSLHQPVLGQKQHHKRHHGHQGTGKGKFLRQWLDINAARRISAQYLPHQLVFALKVLETAGSSELLVEQPCGGKPWRESFNGIPNVAIHRFPWWVWQ